MECNNYCKDEGGLFMAARGAPNKQKGPRHGLTVSRFKQETVWEHLENLPAVLAHVNANGRTGVANHRTIDEYGGSSIVERPKNARRCGEEGVDKLEDCGCEDHADNSSGKSTDTRMGQLPSSFHRLVRVKPSASSSVTKK